MVDLHIVQCWSDVSHQGHKKQGDLKHIILDEIQAVDDFIIPCCMFEIDYEREEPE